MKNVIAGATGVYGAKFTADSTYDASGLHTLGNADFQKFYFTINLKNDAFGYVCRCRSDRERKSDELRSEHCTCRICQRDRDESLDRI